MFFFSFVLVAFFTISLYHILPLLIFNFSHVFFLFAFPSLFKAYFCVSLPLYPSVFAFFSIFLPLSFFISLFSFLFSLLPPLSQLLSLPPSLSFISPLSLFLLSSLSLSLPHSFSTHVTYLLFSSASNFSHTQCLYPLTSRSLFYALALSFHSLKRLLWFFVDNAIVFFYMIWPTYNQCNFLFSIMVGLTWNIYDLHVPMITLWLKYNYWNTANSCIHWALCIYFSYP